MGEGIINYFDAKSALQKKVNKASGDKSDLEEFLALEQIKAQEDELRELMIYTGRAGMWQDWIKFQAEAAHRRRAAEQAAVKARIERQRQMYQWFEIGVALALISTGGIFLVWLFYNLSI